MNRAGAPLESYSGLLIVSFTLAILLYIAGYFWFRSAHSSGMITTISNSTRDSALVTLFDPALRLDAKYGGTRLFFRTDTSGALLLNHKRYPFADFDLQPYNPRASKKPAPSPPP